MKRRIRYGTSLDLLKELPIDGGCAGSSFCIHEATGKLYFCTFPSGNHVAVVDANTNQLLKYLPIDGYVPSVDEQLGQIYIVSRQSPYVLYVIDINTDEFVTVPLCNEAGLTSGDEVNPVTHEIYIGFLQGDSLDIVNGETLKHKTVAGLRGRGMVVNWLENKIYRELVTFDGTWIYDCDSGTGLTIKHENDASISAFNPVSNKIFTDSEVNNYATIIDGGIDTYVNFPMQSCNDPAICNSTNHVYFASTKNIFVLDDATHFLEIIPVDNPTPSSAILCDIAINQSTGRVYVINDGNALDFVTVIQDSESMIRPPVFIGDYGSFTDYILDPVSNMIVEKYSPAYLEHSFAFDPGSSRLYEPTYQRYTYEGSVRFYEGCGNNSFVFSMETGGNDPVAAVINPIGNKIYVTNSGSNNISVIDLGNNTINSSIPVGKTPWGISITPDALKVYVANKNDNNVSVINTVTNNVIETINVGINPYGIAINPSGTKAYVANLGSGTVSVIDIDSDDVIATITVELAPHWLTFTPDGKYVYITNSESSTISVIDAGTDAVIRTISVNKNPEGISAFPDGSKVYVATDTSVNVINTTDYSLSEILLPDPEPPYSHKLIPIAIADPTSKIAGRIMINKVPLNNVIVRVFQEGIEIGNALTNMAGDYSIFNLKAGTYEIEVDAPGKFYQYVKCQTVKTGQTKVVHFNPVTSICTGDSIFLQGKYRKSEGVYNDTFKTINGCDSVITTYLTVNSLPIIDLGSDKTINKKQTLVLDAGSGFQEYEWSTLETSQTILIDSTLGAGSHFIWAMVTNNNNCSNSDTVLITIEMPTEILAIYNLPTVVKVYPNPTSGDISLSIENALNTIMVSIITVNGQVLYEKEFYNLQGKILEKLNLNNHPKGTYIIRVKSGETVITEKLILK
jgi:YVTN family beta-propeller protein